MPILLIMIMLYYFVKFISLCKIVSSYSYTLILVQYINKRLGDYTYTNIENA